MSVRDHLDEARQAAAQCLTTEEVALTIAAWMDSAAMFHRNEIFYRELLIRCGNVLGPEARTDDSGQVHPDVLVLKVPEILENLMATDADGYRWFSKCPEPMRCPLCNGKGAFRWRVGERIVPGGCPACRGGGRLWAVPCKPPVQPESAGTPPAAGV